MSGKIVFKNRNNDKIVFRTEDITEMLINIEENSSNTIGEIYISTADHQPQLLLSIIENNVKYLKDDLEYIKNTFLMILNNNKKT